MIDRMAQLQDEYVSALEGATRIKSAMSQPRAAHGLGEAYLDARAAIEAIAIELRAEAARVLDLIESCR